MDEKRLKMPPEAIDLYNFFIHGEINRRDFMDGLQRFAVGGVTAAALLQALMPDYVRGQQVSRTDERIKATYETVPSPEATAASEGISSGRSAPIRGWRRR